MSTPTSVHRELILPNPVEKVPLKPTSPVPITLALWHTSWLEIHRDKQSAIRTHLGAPGSSELSHTFQCLRETFPGLELGPPSTCPLRSPSFEVAYLLRSFPIERTHYWPMRLLKGSDRAGLLFRSLASKELGEHEVVLQLLFRRVPYWESSFLSGSYDLFIENKAQGRDRAFLQLLQKRKAEPAYHVEIRAAIAGPHPQLVETALLGWVNSWTSIRGNCWWDLRRVVRRRGHEFLDALRDHDILRCAARKASRDISTTEFTQVFPSPWREYIPDLSYAGAPKSSRPQSLALRPKGDPTGRGIVIGQADGEAVCLPAGWHHLAILGKTRSGKSTFALNVATQILAQRPEARVLVLEPTGNLIRELVERLPSEVAQDAVEIDPTRPTFEQDGVEMATVPLNLLHLPNRHSLKPLEFERKSERLMGDFLQSVRNAWGEDSIGGRAEFILRTVIQGLVQSEGSNLVDAYSALSGKEALERLERLSKGLLLKSAFGRTLSNLTYEFTFSSLDKVGKVSTNPLLRKAICQRGHAVSFDQLLERRLLLLNLAKGALGTDASTFLGAIFLTQLWSAIQERPRDAPPIYLVVDEFHNFAIPAFADMLSEGAGHGLHVVAITQYLNRIPDRVRSALVGNVDAWVLFPVGAEDMKEAHALVQGTRFGWKPEHLVGGLASYQAAFAVRDALLKIDTRPAPAATAHAEENRTLLRDSSRRYAYPEDSLESPLSLAQPQITAFLEAFPEKEGMTRDRLAKALGWPPARVEAALTFSIASGDVAEGQGPDGAEFGLRARGFFHRQALALARNEGEEHCDLLADSAAYLRWRGVHVRVVEQEGGYLRPDGEFGWRGRDYHLEVECSTLIKHQEQIVRNVVKAVEDEARCLVIVPDEEAARLFVSVLRRGAPALELWKEVGVLWRAGVEQMVPYVPGPRKPWGFLPGGVEDETKGSLETPIKQEASRTTQEDPHALDVALVRHWAKRFLAAGKWEVTADDFQGVFGETAGAPVDRVRLGMALETLGVKKLRARREGKEKATYYDLRTMSGASKPQSGDPKQTQQPVRDSNDKPQEKGGEPDAKTDTSGQGGQGRADGQTYEEKYEGGLPRGGCPTIRTDPAQHIRSMNRIANCLSRSKRIAREIDPAPSRGGPTSKASGGDPHQSKLGSLAHSIVAMNTSGLDMSRDRGSRAHRCPDPAVEHAPKAPCQRAGGARLWHLAQGRVVQQGVLYGCRQDRVPDRREGQLAGRGNLRTDSLGLAARPERHPGSLGSLRREAGAIATDQRVDRCGSGLILPDVLRVASSRPF